jgi:CMP/dCMP kinase
MPLPNIIAIDGPAASGKTTLGLKIAEDLGYLFFDTGVMYRAITWLAIHHGIPLTNQERITKLAQESEIDISPPTHADGRNSDIHLEGLDITWKIRESEVDKNVSLVSSYGGVRKALSIQQRRIGLRGKVVMVGRDIGTVVLPEADMKIFLEASAEERARRRYIENIQRQPGTDKRQEQVEFKTILDSMIARDRFDSSRDIAPLKAAEDAIIVNSDQKDAEEVFKMVREKIYK